MNIMNLRRFYFSPDDETGGDATETPEEKAARLEAELTLKEKQIRDQNSYITKLEQQKQKTQTQPVTPSQPAPTNRSLSAAEQYAINKATEEEVEKSVKKARELLGEEAAEVVREEVIAIARANIKDPFAVPQDLHDRVVQMATGRAMANPEKRVKIAGAYIKTNDPAPQPQPTVQTVVVPNPADGKIGTMQPGDRQNLGGNPIAQQNQGEKPRSPKDFFSSVRSKK